MMSVATYHVPVTMRDGVVLSADIYRPRGSSKWPAMLVRTCYTKSLHGHGERAQFWVASGYVYIVQDVRGRGDSDGKFYPLVHEESDGSDTIDWIVLQPWSDGRVVMSGGSYLGWTQVYAACSHNPHLVALAPMATPADPDRGFPMSHGMAMVAAGSWAATLDGHINQDLRSIDVTEALSQRPLIDFDTRMGRRLTAWRDWIQHAVRDDYWDRQSYQRRLLNCPQAMLHISGWYDDCLSGALENFSALSDRGLDTHRSVQRLIVGPWLHGTIGQRRLGEIDFGEAAQLDLNELQRDWFDTCLRKEQPKLPAVQVFVMGRNAWITARRWPLPETQYHCYYLHSAGHANSRMGDGSLSRITPEQEPPDEFRYDPLIPVPYAESLDWRQIGGPDDCAALEMRQDILVYTTPPFEEALTLCGPLRVRLFAATTARDTDWTAKILDVYPDGRVIRLNDGAVRARFRQGHDRELLLSPGAVEEYDIDCWATCVELPPGHSLRLEISSSAFGKYDVNLNTGEPVGTGRDPLTAHQTVFHDAERPSGLVVPVLPDHVR